MTLKRQNGKRNGKTIKVTPLHGTNKKNFGNSRTNFQKKNREFILMFETMKGATKLSSFDSEKGVKTVLKYFDFLRSS